jgi:hypothetical protein
VIGEEISCGCAAFATIGTSNPLAIAALAMA